MEKQNNLLGIHHLITLNVKNNAFLTDLNSFVAFTENLLQENLLEKVGKSSFVFENGSYTIAYCLKESHICIHTWPEINRVTMDIYLCNYSQDNSDKVRSISKDFILYFEGDVIKQVEVER
jgi:S-adenosylmethionine decarboxylase